jgi:hypothetical protein
MKRTLLTGVLLIGVAALGVVLYERVSQSRPGRAYAYHVPLNPYHPLNGQWSTLVRHSRVAVGERINVAVAHTSATGAVSIEGARRKWRVVLVRAAADDGQFAAVRGWMGANPVWAGTLVLRPVE